MRTGFIFSLPRAGSTYTQRVLATSPSIATTPETWLFPALYGIRMGDQPLADFGYDHVRKGLGDILDRLDDGEQAWRSLVRTATNDLFSKFSEPDQLFLEKTPRNAFFCKEIIETFPESPVVFLWRNPLSVVASINRTWGRDKWKAYFYHYDLFVGLKSMIDAARHFSENSRVMIVRYEDLVARPEENWPKLFEHFGASYDPQYIVNPRKLISRMGDRTGQSKYTGTESGSLELWRTGFGGYWRKKWVNEYLEWVGTEDLSFMGYNKDELISGLERKGDHHWTDALYVGASPIYHKIEPYAFKSKSGRFGRRKFARR